MIRRPSQYFAVILLLALATVDLTAQVPRSGGRTTVTTVRPAVRVRPPMRRASELIKRQEPINVSVRLLDQVTPDKARVRVSLSKQRAYLLLGDEIVIDTPISSGKRVGMTPSGSYRISQKDRDHRSSVYGDFKDAAGRTVRSGVSSRIDSAPSGTRFVGSPMTWFMRLTDDGVGMHVGILPGYAASHGCIRMPSAAAEMFYNHVKVGTPVVVSD
ncbi:MAG: L,D-transpeptidase family protein [Spartobacteria bacterium]